MLSNEVMQRLTATTTLHHYLIPTAVVVLKASDATFNQAGDLDIASLPEPNFKLSHTLPHTPTEKVIRSHLPISNLILTSPQIVHKLFCSCLLGEDIVDLHADFFQSGGDSLKAGQLVSLLRRQFAVNLPSTCVFTYRTTEKLASYILFSQYVLQFFFNSCHTSNSSSNSRSPLQPLKTL